MDGISGIGPTGTPPGAEGPFGPEGSWSFDEGELIREVRRMVERLKREIQNQEAHSMHAMAAPLMGHLEKIQSDPRLSSDDKKTIGIFLDKLHQTPPQIDIADASAVLGVLNKLNP